MTREELMRNAKPILFNTEMVRAILDGKKTVTRRLVKFKNGKNPKWTGYTKDGFVLYNGINEPCNKEAPCKEGDILYVRETWSELSYGYDYKADGEIIDHLGRQIKWKPSIHMPKEAARIFLKVTDVRAERLQDINIDGIRNEGLSSAAVHVGDMEIALKEWEILWNSTIKNSDIDIYGWGENPWVWVIEFERIGVRF